MAEQRNAAISATAVEWRSNRSLGERRRTIAAAATREGTDIPPIVGMPPASPGSLWIDRAEADADRRLGRGLNRVGSAAFSLRDKVGAVRADVDVTVEVGAKELRAVILQPRDGLG
jgi:hypothetical protein